MSDSSQLVKVIVAIGFLALFASLIYPASGVPAFDNLSGGFPVFSNPFSAKTFTFTAAGDNHDDALYAPLNIRGVDANQAGYCQAHEYPVSNSWYGCLNLADQNATYLTTGFGGFSQGIDVNLTGFPDTTGTWRVLSVAVTFQCKGYGSGIQFGFHHDPDPNFEHVADEIGKSSCHLIGTTPGDDSNLAPGYTNTTMTADTTLDGVYATGTRGISGSVMRIENGGAIGDSDLLFISYVSVSITYQREAGCVFQPTGFPWDDVPRATYFVGCVLGAFFQFVVDGLLFLLNIALYVGSWLIYIATFLADMVSIIAWLYAIPGMPASVQGIVDVVITAMIGFLAISIAKMVRGSEP